jgi:hypothetical protein
MSNPVIITLAKYVDGVKNTLAEHTLTPEQEAEALHKFGGFPEILIINKTRTFSLEDWAGNNATYVESSSISLDLSLNEPNREDTDSDSESDSDSTPPNQDS